MIPWWWFPVALIAGMFAGALITVVIALDKAPAKKRWWEDE